ncbi:interferon regulatory factor 3 isoform X1 [Microcaecilia unicolor]|uniref:Interferon regulatory factor 3 isoform X1 n=1 Tax=Microcaecilia unicolor TaxID=1415580 RepID=A0A6P7XMU3_9AMPH|nr:interferon regulatory factor 3 isoform X1 [Microcaecilia unicolor]
MAQKPRILPWLIEQINSQKFPGLCWTNLEHTEFRVPWKHGLRQDRSDEDFQIFQAWAIASGAFSPVTDQPNPTVWKRNFRSALNRKTNICMKKDHSSDSNDPHKVYSILGGSDSQSPDSAVAPDLFGRSSPSHLCLEENLESELNKLDLSEARTDLYLEAAFQDTAFLELSPLGTSLPLDSAAGMLAYTFITPGQSPIHTTMAASPREDPEALSLNSSLPRPLQDTAALQTNPLEQFFPNQRLETDFEVSVFYRGQKVKSTTVKNIHGLRLVSCQGTGPLRRVEDVVLPEPSTLPRDQEAVRKIHKLLNNLEQGVLLEVNGTDICGQRQGKCRAYWTMTETPSEVEPNEIAKEGYSVLYTVHQFISDLIAFINHTRRDSPLYSMWMCLGERWPDPNRKSWHKKLIMVQVTPVVFKLLHEMSYATGASSLRSSDLQISDSLNSDNLLCCLQDFEERMEH